MSKKYRKKPVVIDALQFTKETEHEAVAFVQPEGFINRGGLLVIRTLEGDMIADYGDWIIRGVQGEHYPCKPDIFEKTYESA